MVSLFYFTVAPSELSFNYFHMARGPGAPGREDLGYFQDEFLSNYILVKGRYLLHCIEKTIPKIVSLYGRGFRITEL